MHATWVLSQAYVKAGEKNDVCIIGTKDSKEAKGLNAFADNMVTQGQLTEVRNRLSLICAGAQGCKAAAWKGRRVHETYKRQHGCHVAQQNTRYTMHAPCMHHTCTMPTCVREPRCAASWSQ